MFFKSQFRVYLRYAQSIQGCYFSMFFYVEYISLYLVFAYASSFIPFYNDYIFIVYFTLRSAFNTISTEKEKLKQLMDQDVSSSPSAQVVGLKHALSSVSYMSVSRKCLSAYQAHADFIFSTSMAVLKIHEKTKQIIRSIFQPFIRFAYSKDQK